MRDTKTKLDSSLNISRSGSRFKAIARDGSVKIKLEYDKSKHPMRYKNQASFYFIFLSRRHANLRCHIAAFEAPGFPLSCFRLFSAASHTFKRVFTM